MILISWILFAVVLSFKILKLFILWKYEKYCAHGDTSRVLMDPLNDNELLEEGKKEIDES